MRSHRRKTRSASSKTAACDAGTSEIGVNKDKSGGRTKRFNGDKYGPARLAPKQPRLRWNFQKPTEQHNWGYQLECNTRLGETTIEPGSMNVICDLTKQVRNARCVDGREAREARNKDAMRGDKVNAMRTCMNKCAMRVETMFGRDTRQSRNRFEKRRGRSRAWVSRKGI